MCHQESESVLAKKCSRTDSCPRKYVFCDNASSSVLLTFFLVVLHSVCLFFVCVCVAEKVDQAFYIKFAVFEERQRELERARMIYRLALERLPKGKGDELYRK